MDADDERPLRWSSRPPIEGSQFYQPGLRHSSRLFTAPRPWLRPPDSFPDAQIKNVGNYFGCDPQLLMLLLDAKSIFNRQLPNMGSPYITRLVYDAEAENVILLHNGRLSGAICYRLFRAESFVEIVFCAVESIYQARGYGRLIMNVLKTVLQSYEIFDVLTCADNEAVPYFRKQGFNGREILMNPKRWVGCIKDYEGITLVHCRIHPIVDYMRMPDQLRAQESVLQKKTGSRVSNPALPRLAPPFKPFAQAPSFVSAPISSFLIFSVSHPKTESQSEPYLRSLRAKGMRIVAAMRDDPRFGSTFFRPVTEDIAPGYFQKVKRPMDLLTIWKRLVRFRDYYKRPEVFASDFRQMFDDCRAFNSPDTVFHRQAVDGTKRFADLYSSEFPNNPIPPE